jgi:L-lactate dehydrogenase complex protein LldG
MNNKEDILNNVKRHIRTQYDMPEIAIAGIQFPDKTAKFIEVSKSAGGDAVILEAGQDINEFIKLLYPDAKTIASNLPDISIATLNPDTVDDPHTLTGIDLAVVQGEAGVAENGCVWLPQNVRHKAVYFISEYLVILLDRNNIVNNMHEAYRKIQFSAKGFGAFISGPSKTADIEQSLVVGAHGAKGVTVMLR